MCGFHASLLWYQCWSFQVKEELDNQMSEHESIFFFLSGLQLLILVTAHHVFSCYFNKASFKWASVTKTSFMSVTLQGVEHSSNDSTEIRKINFPSGLQDCLCREAHSIALCGIGTIRSVLCKACFAWDILDKIPCSKEQNWYNLYSPPKVVAHPCGKKCVKFYLLLVIRVIICPL